MEIGRSSTRSQNIGPQSKPFFLLSFPKGQIGRFSIRSQYHRGSRIQAISLELLEQRKIGRSSMGCQLPGPESNSPFVVSSCANSGKIGRSSMGSQLPGPEPKSYSFPPSVPNRQIGRSWIGSQLQIPLRDLDAVGIWRESLPITGYVPALRSGMSPVPGCSPLLLNAGR
jgi:hypothetical protein